MTNSLKCEFLRKSWLTRLFLLSSFLWMQSATAGTDVVEFINGDRLTGEAKSLDRGRLKFDTEPTGVIYIEWEKVAFLKTSDSLQVETENGDRFFGPIQRSENAYETLVETSQGAQKIRNGRVVSIDQIDAAGFSNIDLSASVGYNFTKASDVTQFNVGAEASYRTRIRELHASFSSFISDSTGNDASQRQALNLNYTRLRANRWLNDGGVSFDRNDELGLNLRTSLSAGGGRILMQSNHSRLVLKGGLKATRENNVDEAADLDSVESYGIVSWDWFRFDSPELDWSTTLEIIPSLTESGRVRGQFDTTLKWEIFEDLFWQLQFYDSYDNKPQSVDASDNDFGITTSLSYDF